MNVNNDKNFLTGLFAGLAAGLLLTTLILTILIMMLIHGGSPSKRAGHAAYGKPAAGYQAPAAKAVPPAFAGAVKSNAPFRGSASGPVYIEEFADFHCGFCRKAEPTMQKIIQNYGGKVRLAFRHFPLSSTPGQGSYLTHEAAACADQQGKFWPFHDAIFAMPNSPQPKDLDAIAQKIGLNQTTYKNCVQNGGARDTLKKEAANGQAAGVSGTPSFLINGKLFVGAQPYENFEKIIKDVLSGKAPQGGTVPAPQQAGGQKPEPPKAVNITDNDGRPTDGPKDAKVTLTIFSDFHCPFCKKVEPTIDQLMQAYKGKIRKVWRHFPLSFHAGADRTHEASECAHDQGKFWAYHDVLIKTPAPPANDQDLIRLAGDAKLDKKKFEKCLSDGKKAEVITKDKEKGGQYGVQGTPAVFVNGKLVSGAQPFDNFDRLVKEDLAKK